MQTRLLIPALLLFGITACTKAKVPNSLPVIPLENAPNSSLRLYNFYGGGLDITINNIQLTNYDTTGQATATSGATPAGGAYFPKGVWQNSGNGSPFTIPTTLLDKEGKAHITISARPFGPTYNPYHAPFKTIDTVLLNDPAAPTDYYVLWTGNFQILPRSVATPASPYDIKIRVCNFSAPTDTMGLTGAASLAWSDGTPVDPALTNIAPNQASSYVEIPFGAYQFKAFMNNDPTKQLSGPGSTPVWSCGGPEPPQEAIFPNITTFQPGYTYSIFITPIVSDLLCFNTDNFTPVNSYLVLADNGSNPNTTFALVQAVNAMPSGPVQFRIDGIPIGGSLNYTQYTTTFNPVVFGTHTIQAYDASGNLLVAKPYTFYAYDYITAWVYDKQGIPDIAFTNNDMTSSTYLYNNQLPNEGASDDGTNGSIRVAAYPNSWQCRFLNLSNDMPYTTFTNDLALMQDVRGMIDSAATINLAQGYVPPIDWDVVFTMQYNQGVLSPGQIPTAIRVNQSDPGPPPVIPGALRYDIQALYPQNFIANPNLYTSGYAPPTEPGVYSVALVGNANGDTTGAAKGKLIIVKHFK